MFDCSELAHMAEDFFGNGRWDAPFWFIVREYWVNVV
jgi:hypothetical protein